MPRCQTTIHHSYTPKCTNHRLHYTHTYTQHNVCMHECNNLLPPYFLFLPVPRRGGSRALGRAQHRCSSVSPVFACTVANALSSKETAFDGGKT